MQKIRWQHCLQICPFLVVVLLGLSLNGLIINNTYALNGNAAGDFWITPATTNVQTGQTFDLVVHVNADSSTMGAYQVQIDFDQNLVSVDSLDVNGVLGNVNSNIQNGNVQVAEFNLNGVDGSTDVTLFTMHCTANNPGTANFTFSTTILTDETGTSIGNPTGTPATVNITTPQNTLTVTINGSGSVISSPAGIDCPGTCSAEFDENSQVTLTATPAASYSFAGWSGACSGTGPCTVTMDSDQQVTATFNGPGLIGFENDSISARENEGALTIQVCRTDGTNGQASVSYDTVDGTATADQDYQAASGTLTWNDGEGGCKSITITLIDNEEEDGDRTFSIALSNFSGADPSNIQRVQVNIADDDNGVVVAAPTINEWGKMIFGGLMLLGGLFYYRRYLSLE